LRFDGVTAEVYAGFVENWRGARYGMATENLDARNKVRYSKPAQETTMVSEGANEIEWRVRRTTGVTTGE